MTRAFVSTRPPHSAEGAWGHPQTRLGIDVARGEYFVRINDDDQPSPGVPAYAGGGLSGNTGISYARVVFKGDARKAYSYLLRGSYVIPRDRLGVLENGNIDCLCYMVRIEARPPLSGLLGRHVCRRLALSRSDARRWRQGELRQSTHRRQTLSRRRSRPADSFQADDCRQPSDRIRRAAAARRH